MIIFEILLPTSLDHANAFTVPFKCAAVSKEAYYVMPHYDSYSYNTKKYNFNV
jgi:hypothetical protein